MCEIVKDYTIRLVWTTIFIWRNYISRRPALDGSRAQLGGYLVGDIVWESRIENGDCDVAGKGAIYKTLESAPSM